MNRKLNQFPNLPRVGNFFFFSLSSCMSSLETNEIFPSRYDYGRFED